MDWDQITESVESSERQRCAGYKFVIGVDPDDLRALIREMTSPELSAFIASLTAADNRLKAKLVVVKRPVDPLLLIEQEEEKMENERRIPVAGSGMEHE
jgi:hypothetical protein